MGFWNFIAKFAAEKPVPLPPQIKKLPLKSDQYYPTAQKKTHIILHHTAGGSAASSVAGWAATPEHIATPYIIDRDGTIYETYSPEFWAYHLGVKGATWLEKASIGIEICSYGQLTPNVAGELLTYTKKVIPKEKAAKVSFRGFEYYEAYTPEQIAALKQLLPYLMDRFGIKPQADRKNFWEYRDAKTLPPGIWSHTTVRKDKVDIFPQKEIVELVNSL
jgi:N-acetyl-anhydromuramyl-L-alanine amidase AmpD